MTDDLLIYTPKTTNRIRYIFDLVLNDILGLSYQITNNATQASAWDKPKISYSPEPLNGALWIKSHALLFESDVRPQSIEVKFMEEKPYFFDSDAGDFPFDIFSAAFYLVSRYEEYLPYEKDAHGRFEADQSLAFQNNFLRTPIVNMWAQWLVRFLPAISAVSCFVADITKLHTFDVDRAFAWKERSIPYKIGTLGKSLIHFRISEFFYKIQVLLNLKNDPFDVFAYLENKLSMTRHGKYFFFLVGKRGPFDLNNELTDDGQFRHRIALCSRFAKIGLHPSYHSNVTSDELKEEKLLEKHIGELVTASRQHFLKLNLPNTYRNLIEAGIRADFTMGYASQPGFRAGIATPFHFFDLHDDKRTELVVYPFACMDRTFISYLKCTSEEAIEIILFMEQQVKQYGGYFISLWHNELLTDDKEGRPWRKVFEATLF